MEAPRLRGGAPLAWREVSGGGAPPVVGEARAAWSVEVPRAARAHKPPFPEGKTRPMRHFVPARLASTYTPRAWRSIRASSIDACT